MNAARIASEKISDFQQLLQLVTRIDQRLEAIHECLKKPVKSRSDDDVVDLAIYYLYQTSGNVSEVAKRLEEDGFHVRRPSLMHAKKFARFQDAHAAYRGSGPKRGHRTDSGEIEGVE